MNLDICDEDCLCKSFCDILDPVQELYQIAICEEIGYSFFIYNEEKRERTYMEMLSFTPTREEENAKESNWLD